MCGNSRCGDISDPLSHTVQPLAVATSEFELLKTPKCILTHLGWRLMAKEANAGESAAGSGIPGAAGTGEHTVNEKGETQNLEMKSKQRCSSATIDPHPTEEAEKETVLKG